MKTAIKGGRIVLPDRFVDGAALLFDEKITDVISDDEITSDTRVIDAENGVVVPGFVDIHVHGGGGYDFLDEAPEATPSILKTHLSHGTTSLLATTLTCPDEILYRGVGKLGREIERGFAPGECEILGLHLEGPYFSSAAKGAQAIRKQKIPTLDELEKLYTLAKGHIVRFDGAPELPEMDLFARWTKEKGILASIGHSGANAETALEYYKKGFSHITHMYCSTTTEHKEGQVVHGGIIEAAYLEDGFRVELIGDGKHIPRETMLLVFKIKGVDSTMLVTDAMRAAGTDVTESILGEKETGTRVIVEDGVAKLPDRSSFAGSVATMDVCLRTAVRYGIPLVDAVKSCTLTPARTVGFGGRKGSLEKGKDADIVILDRELNVRRVFARGKEAN